MNGTNARISGRHRAIITAWFAIGALAFAVNAIAQTRVVDLVPQHRSGETNTDSEPTLAIDPSNFDRMVGTAFTWDNLTMAPMTTALAPIFVSTDRGSTWTLAPIVPSAIGSSSPTGDINPTFSGILSGAPLHETGWLYTGILEAGTSPMVVLRTPDYLDTTTAMSTLDAQMPNVDQPHTSVLSWFGQDKLFVGFNNGEGCVKSNGRTSTIDVSGSATATSPTFTLDLIESRDSTCQDGFAQVPAAHLDGTVYAAFIHDWAGSPRMVVVRDDAYASSTSPFTALMASGPPTGDGQPGQFATTTFTLPSGTMGNTRLGASNVNIAVDPRDSDRVYLAYGDAGSPSASDTETIHVVRSIDRGQSWSGDLLTVTNAMNPEIGISALGTVGVLYQRVVTTNWEAHLVRTTDPDGTTFDTPGILLANTPVIASNPVLTIQPQIGDYASLRAAGKNFYGIFSAANTPISANFPQGVTYQRYVDWTKQQLYADAAHSTAVAPSIDPFFFEVDAVPPDLDFYVRDWTDDATHADSGTEPSTHPDFFSTSDVWNRRSPAPGPFTNDQPTNEDAGNGSGSVGTNYAFVRVRRNAAGTASTVTAHFLVAKFGTGSNWVDSTVSDPDLTLPADSSITTDNTTGPWISPPWQWQLSAISGNHLCLAVQISAPGSPYIPPSLVGQTVGLGAAPFTDIRIRSDNHKAQRNMHLSTTAASGSPSGGSITDYAIVHNGDVMTRDIPIQITVSGISKRYIRAATIRAVLPNGRSMASREGSADLGETLVLSRVRPGENRWVAINLQSQGILEGGNAYVDIEEKSGGTVVGGFAVGVAVVSNKEAVASAFENFRSVAARLDMGFDAHESSKYIEESRKVNPERFPQFIRTRLLPRLEADLVRARALDRLDQFGIQTLLRDAATEKGMSPLIDHFSSLMNAIDAGLTTRQLEKGDPADIVQMVRWQKQLFRTRPALAKLRCAPEVIDASRRFLKKRESGNGTNASDYPAHLNEVLSCLREAVRAIGGDGANQPAATDLTALERAHRDYLEKLAD